MLRSTATLSALAIAAAPSFAQSNVSPYAKHAWSENCGWLNFRDAGNPAASSGVVLLGSHLRGYAWGENIGYINFGQGPLNSVAYSNTTGLDFGVNRDPLTNRLSGYAWTENVGWINFAGGALATPPNPARFDPATKRLRGYAWGENIGWINLDDASAFVGTCAADFNNSGGVTVQDVFDFLTAWFSSDIKADFNSSNSVTVQDIFDFLTAWFQGC